jgi:hypothetical protein
MTKQRTMRVYFTPAHWNPVAKANIPGFWRAECQGIYRDSDDRQTAIDSLKEWFNA